MDKQPTFGARAKCIVLLAVFWCTVIINNHVNGDQFPREINYKSTWGTRVGRSFLNLVCDSGTSENVQQLRLDCVLNKGPNELRNILEACFYNTTKSIRSADVVKHLCNNEETMRKLNTCFTMSEVPGSRPPLPPKFATRPKSPNLNFQNRPNKISNYYDNTIDMLPENDIRRNIVKRHIPMGMGPNNGYPRPGWFLPNPNKPVFKSMRPPPPMYNYPGNFEGLTNIGDYVDQPYMGYQPMLPPMRPQVPPPMGFNDKNRRPNIKWRPRDLFSQPITRNRNPDLIGQGASPVEPRHDAYTELLMMCERETPKTYYHT